MYNRWITPSIFESVDQSLGIVDEYTLGQRLPDQAPSILQNHWDSWVSFDDFQTIASSGMNLVRIPIGFWAYNNTGYPFIQGAAPYLDKAIGWARSTSPPLKVIIDLHGAPSSQNGFDNSGQRRSSPGWLVDGGWQGSTSQMTLDVLNTIAQKYADLSYHDVVVGIELLNEPLGYVLNNDNLRQFYREGYRRVRQVSDTVVVLQDAFLPPSSFNGFMVPSDLDVQWVAMDHHYYQVFDDESVAMVPWQHRQAVCNSVDSFTGADKWTFIGEWTAAMTDCARYLNGYGVGARYDGTYPGSKYVGSCSWESNIANWPSSYLNDTRGFIEAQMEAFEANSQGWIFWNFKTESSAEWSLFTLQENNVFPNPVTDRWFGPVCTAYYKD